MKRGVTPGAGDAPAAPPRLLLLTSSYPRHAGDPAGSFVAGFARAFVAAGWSVEVLAPDDATAPAATERPAAEPGITVGRVRYAWPRTRQRLFYGAGAPENLAREPLLGLQAPAFTAALAAAARRRAAGATLVVGHWLLPGGVAAALGAAGRAPWAAVCHSGDLWMLERLPGRRLLAAALLAGARRLLFVGGHLLERFAALLPAASLPELARRAVVLPMGVEAPSPLDAGRRRQLRLELGRGPGPGSGLEPDRPLLLFLGRLVPIKGLDLLLDAAAGLPLELVLTGGGPEEAALRARAAAAGLRCHFPGWVAGETKAAWLQAADALVLPSRTLAGRSEGLPVAALEALAAGLPVLASASGGLPEVVWDAYNGLLVPGGGGGAAERAAWRTALSRLLQGLSTGEWETLRVAAARSGQAFRWEVLGPRLVEELVRPPGGAAAPGGPFTAGRGRTAPGQEDGTR